MGRNWAITIGINYYDNLQPLKYARQDAEAMENWFKQEANFEQVFLFTENSPNIPTNPPIPTQPTHARFVRFLNVQFEQPLLKPEDNLWFFFAGHGIRYQDQDYLMFLDSDPQAIDKTAISVDYVVQRLRRCGADNIVLLIDACRNDSSRDGLGIGQQKHKGIITFYSCNPNQKSFEIDELQHGIFTYILLEGLRLQGESNCATVERLDQYLRYNVPKINFSYKKQPQNPYLKAEPPYKMYYILLDKAATLKDAESLKYQASLAENKGDFILAKQLWIRVLALPGVDQDAIEAIERISQIKGKPSIYSTKSVSDTSSRGKEETSLEILATQENELHFFEFDSQNISDFQNKAKEEIKKLLNNVQELSFLEASDKFSILESYVAKYKIQLLKDIAVNELIYQISNDKGSIDNNNRRKIRQKILGLILSLHGKDLSRLFTKNEFVGIDLYGIDLSGSNLTGVNLSEAFIVDANFSGAILDNANFSNAAIRNTNFSTASIKNTIFTNADWFNAQGFTLSQIKESNVKTLLKPPLTEEERIQFLDDYYTYPFHSWGKRIREEIKSSWEIYFKQGGIAEKLWLFGT